MRYILLFCFILTLLSCKKDFNHNPLNDILDSDHPAIAKVMDNLEAHEVQIKVSEVVEWTTGDISTNTHEFQVNDNNYFYPASSVKLPIAVLALEKVNTIEGITSESRYHIENDSIFSTIRDDIRDIFTISGNASYNRLYEFLGRDYINAKLKKKGLQSARISHRLEHSDAINSKTKTIVFYKNDSTSLKLPFMVDSPVKTYPLKRLKKGKGFYKEGTLVNSPMDFSKKNYISISTLHEMMLRIQFPDTYEFDKQFILNSDDRKFLLNAMKVVPRHAGFDEQEYYDGYVKFFLFGDTKERIPDHISISNKVGYAYGYLTDCAYIVDHKHRISFIVTATIHVNSNGIFNDDVYNYESIGIPFLAEIGRQLHQYYVDKALYLDKHGD
ncbi:serine hydrolase [Psychroserpens sp. MEBiC05023]